MADQFYIQIFSISLIKNKKIPTGLVLLKFAYKNCF